MAAAFAFIGMLLLSLVVAQLAALQLGDFFSSDGLIGVLIVVISAFAIVSFAVQALTYRLAQRAAHLNLTALALAVPAAALALVPGAIWHMADSSVSPYVIDPQALPLILELTIPALIAVLVQWGLLRRRWLITAGEDELTRWPWVTTIVAGLVVLNPFGLSAIQATLAHSPADAAWEFSAAITAVALGVLLVMAWIECYIRERMLNRRLAPGAPMTAHGRPSLNGGPAGAATG